ncbi:sigma factor-like helix-turn-helix DNA-binding protein [Alicyclobacillus macrosporangiidus]|uniref:sigma factor-like helix-turn-helix DNA-binding protein n=1 Tax=Alicyclobacillus macrosporangiidus TaxID=392015 RepID=UPI0004953305|nr:LuxR C-terminal-related transcriptional regulator [Alicyclobacillus macrosporangiidus]
MGRRDLEDLIAQYEATLQQLKAARNQFERLARTDPSLERDARLCESMVRTVDYAICQMEGCTRITHREILVGDVKDLDRLAARSQMLWETEAEDERQEEDDDMPVAWNSVLTKREAACLFAYERGMSFSAIAEALGITRASVQSYVERARAKLDKLEWVQLALWDDSPALGA